MAETSPAAVADDLTITFPAWVRRFPLTPSKAPPLSHYTTSEGLQGICSSNAIWATCAQYSNDRSEVLHAQSVAKEVFDEFFKKGWEVSVGGQFVKSYLQKSAGLGDDGEITEAYVASFCEASDLLSQWRAYGKTAGFEIRFESLTVPSPIVPLEKPLVGSPAVDAVRLVRVEYDRQAQKQMIFDCINGAYEVLGILEAKNPGRTNLHVAVAALATLELIVRMYRIKHPSFSEEKEWRIIGFPKRNDFFSETYSHREKLRFRAGRHCLVPYIELRPNEGKLPLSEIVCGPGGHHKLTSKAVELLLAANGFGDVSVRNSAVPLVL